jgi:hypothetical protein
MHSALSSMYLSESRGRFKNEADTLEKDNRCEGVTVVARGSNSLSSQMCRRPRSQDRSIVTTTR